VAVVVTGKQNTARSRRVVGECPRLVATYRQRFFAQDVQTTRESGVSDFGVRIGRRCNVDEIEIALLTKQLDVSFVWTDTGKCPRCYVSSVRTDVRDGNDVDLTR